MKKTISQQAALFLKPGEIVVTGGVQFLQDGMQVRLGKEILTAAVQASSAER